MIVLQGGVFHYRRVVPSPIRSLLGQREVWVSLKTPYRRIAESRAARFNGLVEGVFMAARRKLVSSLSDDLGADPRDELIRLLQDTLEEQSTAYEALQQAQSIEFEARKIEALTNRIKTSTEYSVLLQRLGGELDVALPAVSKLCVSVVE